jgi:hypothetical protein
VRWPGDGLKEFTVKTLAACFLCSFLGMGICLVASHRPVAAAETCWLVFYVSSGGPGDTDDEVICLTSQTEGYVRETSIFGTGAIGCNRVSVNRSGGAMDFIVDHSKCTNNSPSHSISCPSPSGDRIKCVADARPG